jgi:hypothetical protein
MSMSTVLSSVCGVESGRDRLIIQGANQTGRLCKHTPFIFRSPCSPHVTLSPSHCSWNLLLRIPRNNPRRHLHLQAPCHGRCRFLPTTPRLQGGHVSYSTARIPNRSVLASLVSIVTFDPVVVGAKGGRNSTMPEIYERVYTPPPRDCIMF